MRPHKRYLPHIDFGRSGLSATNRARPLLRADALLLFELPCVLLLYTGLFGKENIGATHFAAALIGLILAGYFAFRLALGKFVLGTDSLTLVYVLWVLMIGSTSLWSVSEAYMKDKLFLFLTMCQLLFLCGVHLIKPRVRLEGLFLVHTAICAPFALYYVFLEVRFGFSSYDANMALAGRNYQIISYIMGYGILLATFLFSSPHVQSRNRRLGLMALIALFLIILAQSGGRGGVLIILVGLGIFFGILKARSALNSAVIVVGILVILAVVGPIFATQYAASSQQYALPSTFARIVDHVVNKGQYEYIYQSRDLLQRASIDLWLQKPLFGWGFGAFPIMAGFGDVRNYPHNIVLELLAETGLMGTVPFITFVLATATRLWRQWLRYRQTNTACVLSLFAAALSSSMVSWDLVGNRTLFVVFGIAVAQATLGEQNTRRWASHTSRRSAARCERFSVGVDPEGYCGGGTPASS